MLRSSSTSTTNQVLVLGWRPVAAWAKTGVAASLCLKSAACSAKSDRKPPMWFSSLDPNSHFQAIAVLAASLTPLVTPIYATVSFIAGH